MTENSKPPKVEEKKEENLKPPKVEEKKEVNKRNFTRNKSRSDTPHKAEFISKTTGLKEDTFDVGNAKYAAKYQKSVDKITIHIAIDQDVIQLLKIVRGYCCSFNDHQQSTFALGGAKHMVSTHYQGYNDTTTEYLENFKALVGVVETYGGAYGRKPGLVEAELIVQGHPASVVAAKIKAAEAVCCEQLLLCMRILRGADSTRYFQLKTDLANDTMTKGLDHFPKTIVDTMRLLNNYKVPARHNRQNRQGDGDSVAFVQGDKQKAAKEADAPLITEIECWHYNKKGHYKNEWPELQVVDEGVQNLAINDCQLNTRDVEENEEH